MIKRGKMGFGIKSRLMNPSDAVWDWKLRVSTFGYAPSVGVSGDPHRRNHYQPTPYVRAQALFRNVRLNNDDVVMDLGCGLGRMVFLAAYMGASRSIGIDLNSDLISIAQRMVDGTRVNRDGITFIEIPAEEADFDPVTVLYIFHSFGPGTMKEVMTRVEESLRRNPRILRIIYENPVYPEAIDAISELEPIGHWPTHQRPKSGYEVKFWSNETQVAQSL